ncbi:hypothetical protein F0U44_05280 [Nocardioides humilatus]|uniref:Uncharacterized protein n=1 Tax=Nocardioides humilatus TaxID=2607660 RepID=A0A5B1LNJ9_9ACTN|nr:hypothetical protein [Nocardioides humilatus]KAA1421688.1 hypothetical protein F0U44_05280 [Nocardioides humilatus]
MSNQYPGPGQPGDLPPTQVAPGGVPPQQPPPQQPYGAPPQQPYGAPPATPPYGAPLPPGGGFPPPPGGGFPAPPTGGGGKRIGLILGIVGAVVALIIIVAVVLVVVLGGDDDSDSPKKRVTITSTLPTEASTELTTPTEVTTPPTEITTSASTDTGFPTEDPSITAAAYLNSVLESNCLAVEGLSTPEWFASAYGDQKGCKKAGGDQDMSTAIYDTFSAPVDNGDGSVTITTTVTDSSDTTGTQYDGTWILVPTDDNTTWLVNGFQLVES